MICSDNGGFERKVPSVWDLFAFFGPDVRAVFRPVFLQAPSTLPQPQIDRFARKRELVDR
ncbi:hypothetical protein HMPREF9440_01329 [Sutterella parvirubra YIT 11816]|uniref:Uncharacterized protein n=1 Tax=Sutterella parvirubra YIT 11816 TaxID=762967 RepID=H3KF13_9BURK|nr:hypothetical protein HMPREF9440_01329 [Sutterella parvirubra YIT 11816]